MIQDAAPAGLQSIDWMIIAFYAAGTIGLGWYYGRRQTSTQEYFVGDRQMSPTLIGVSLFATLLSTITYLSSPGEMIGKGPAMGIAYMVTFPLTFFIVGYLVIPIYMRQRVTSAYELLEEKLGIGVRLLAAVMFLVLRLMWMSLLVYTAAAAMTVMLGVGEDAIPLIVLVTTIVSVTYTSLGGLRAVVITDLIQTILLLGGALLVIATVTMRMGGFGWYPSQWQPHWDHQPLLSFDPKTRVSVIGQVIRVTVWYVCTAGGDQTAIQRFMATGGVKAARKSFLMQLIVALAVSATLWHVGLSLMGYFQAHPDALPAGMTLADNADQIFPHYIAFDLPCRHFGAGRGRHVRCCHVEYRFGSQLDDRSHHGRLSRAFRQAAEDPERRTPSGKAHRRCHRRHRRRWQCVVHRRRARQLHRHDGESL